MTYLKKEKGIALRKKVMKKNKQMPKSFNITFFNEDNSSNKEVSMLRLKSELMQNRFFFKWTLIHKEGPYIDMSAI